MKRKSSLMPAAIVTILVAVFISFFSAELSLAQTLRGEALVLVNSSSPSYSDFRVRIQPYLDNFGVPYKVLDIASTPVGPDIAEYSVLIIGHRQIDPTHVYLDEAEESNISSAVRGGTGLVNFDNDLSTDGSTARYQFVQDIFGFGYVPPSTGSGVEFLYPGGMQGILINCWEDSHQDPVLVTTTNSGDLIATDGRWTEFLASSRPYPTVAAAAGEKKYGLPVMHFYTSGIPNGEYEVIANLYTNVTGRNMRYYYGFTPSDPKAHYVDTIGGAGGSDQHEEYSLGQIEIVDGTFNIYVQDADLLAGSYPFFGWAWVRLAPVGASSQGHYITERHIPGEMISTNNMTLGGITLPAGVTALARTGNQPFMAVTNAGNGRAVQWGTYDWIANSVKGPVYGLDDLVWRSIVWAARKPFVMQGMPPFVTMRVDDGKGPFNWISSANGFGIKPWVGIFRDEIDETEAAALSNLVLSGNATTSIHSLTDANRFYTDSSGSDSVRKDLYLVVVDGTLGASLAGPSGIPGGDWRTNIPVETNTWTHVALTYDGSTMSMYKNGVKVATTNASGSLMLADPSSNESLFIGANTGWGEYFDGLMDDVRVYNGALSDQEVFQIYQLVDGTSSPVADWKFDEGGGLVAYDSSIYRNDGALINFDPAIDWVPGMVGGALHFNGGNSYVEARDNPSFRIANEITVAAWINPTVNSGWRTIVSKLSHNSAVMVERFAEATKWHQDHNIPISKFVVPHYYEFSASAFQGLSDWGVEYLGTHMDPGTAYGSPWLMGGPYRLYEPPGSSRDSRPVYYADFINIPGHPEFNGKFFNCVTEIRDDAGYEWYPGNDVSGSIGRGTRQLERALDSMVLATLFTHENYISPISPGNWQAILQGITNNIASYSPIYVTMDYACQYVRAIYTSNITSSIYDPILRRLTTTLVGHTDMPTKFYLFNDVWGTIIDTMVDVPQFIGSTSITQEFGAPAVFDHFTFDNVAGPVTAGVTFGVRITAYDQYGNVVSAYTGQAALSDTTGTISPTTTGSFVNGVWSGNVTIGQAASGVTITARSGVATGTSNAFNVVAPPVLDHFTFDNIAGPVTAGVAFGVRITAYDQFGNVLSAYTGQAALSDTTGTIGPATTGSFVKGVWSGNVTIGQAASGVTITARNGVATGTSNAFNVVAPPPTEVRINCWDDAHQDPILPTTTNSGDLSTTDGKWTEFKYSGRPYSALFAGVNEENLGLPVMRFYATGIQNGVYRVFANLYTWGSGRTMRYYFGYQSSAPKANYVDVAGMANDAYQFREIDLGTITITGGSFNIYVRDADLINGTYPYFGWAWIRLVPVQN